MHHVSPRFRIRSLLILVAIIAFALGFQKTRQRWAVYRAFARDHASHEEGCLWSARQCETNVAEYVPMRQRFLEQGNFVKMHACEENSALFAAEADRLFQKAAFHTRMRQEYESRW